MFKQITLDYNFSDLEPFIDALTMETHYTKHHSAYTNNLNAAIEKVPAFADWTIEKILTNLDQAGDEALAQTIRNNGGGFYNHNLYFSTMKPGGANEPFGDLAAKITETFGGYDALKEKLSALSIQRFGSGWAWLSANKAGDLKVSSSPNQDNPLYETNGEWTPILGIDVWEHAYYLKYKNLRGDYVKAFYEVLNWDEIAKIYTAVTK